MGDYIMYKLFTTSVVVAFLFFNSLNLSANGSNHLSKDNGVIFKENKGQVHDQYNNPRPDVLFSGESKGLIYHLKNDGLHYQIVNVESWKNVETPLYDKQNSKNQIQGNQYRIPDKVSVYHVDVNWKNINNNPMIEVGEEIQGYENFYNVSNSSNPVLGVRSYKSIIYKNIYEGIDLKFYEGGGDLEYDFIVQPGADFRQIKMEYNGAEITTNHSNELVLKTPFGEIREGVLKVYQDNKQIVANWNINNEVVTFDIPKYDPTKPIRIDPPTRLWGTYYGGSDDEYGWGVFSNNSNVFLVGRTSSSSNIATTGSHQQTISGSADAFLVKFTSNGIREWATYYGGSGTDIGYAVESDYLENVYLVGATSSTNNIATSGSHQSTHGGSIDGFLVKFDSDGYR